MYLELYKTSLLNQINHLEIKNIAHHSLEVQRSQHYRYIQGTVMLKYLY